MTLPAIPEFLIGISETVALAAVALIGYLYGLRARRTAAEREEMQQLTQWQRASITARQLEAVAQRMRQALAAHHAQVARFESKLKQAREQSPDESQRLLASEADSILAPTQAIFAELSQAYDQIRRQSRALASFAAGRTDHLTGVGNAAALESQFGLLMHELKRTGERFAVALLSLDRPSDKEAERISQRLLCEAAQAIQLYARESDFVARTGAEEFIVLMPRTGATAAGMFIARLREELREQVRVSASGGVTEAGRGDTLRTVLARADAAVYSARAARHGGQFVNRAIRLREHAADQIPSDRSVETVSCGGS